MNRPVLPIAVIIASRNRATLLADTVTSIANGSALPTEIVVIDQSDGSAPSPVWRDPHGHALRHIRVRPAGVSAARNMGARAAQTPLLAFTDDDMEADREWLASLYRALTQAGSRAAVTGRVVSGAPERAGAFVAATVDRSTPAVYSGRLGVDVLAGGNMAMHRDAFLRLGGFDERLGPGTAFPAAEDNDLGFRILRAGLPIVYVPDAVLTHRAWRGADDYIGLRYAYGLGKGGFYLKHLHLSDWHTAGRLARDLLQRGRRTVRFAREPRRAVGEIAYAVGVLSGACEWLVRQPSVPWPEERAGHDV